VAWLGTQPGIVHTIKLHLSLRTWFAETVATLSYLWAVQRIFEHRRPISTLTLFLVRTLVVLWSGATMVDVSMSLVQAIEEVAGPGVDTNGIFPQK